jgi:hypothetical protein
VIGRREALATLGALLAACGGRAASAPAGPPPEELKTSPVVDLVAAPGLVWVLDARLRELLASPVLVPAVAMLVPEARFDAFAARNGGVDLRQAGELAIATYDDSTLAIARVILDPARVEAAFAARAVAVEGRAVEGTVTRTWGSVGSTREQIAILGREAVALERGQLGPLRAAEYFARGKLHRALPALRAEPLARAVALLGDAPLRGFAPGPFRDDWAAGLGGLLRATTAVAVSATPADHPPSGALSFQVVLTGAWGADAQAGANRLRAAFDLLANDPLGRLMGVDHPLDGPRVSGDPDALRLSVALDPLVLAGGLHAATDASVEEVMRL